jgi:hypothetical protein
MKEAKSSVFTATSIFRYAASFLGPLGAAMLQIDYVKNAIAAMLKSHF